MAAAAEKAAVMLDPQLNGMEVAAVVGALAIIPKEPLEAEMAVTATRA